MNPLLEQILATRRVEDESGNYYDLHSHVDKSEVQLLSDLIASDATICRTLEVGCAYGLSSLAICDAISGRKDRKHVIVDPFQDRDWKGIGVANLRRGGFDFFELIQEPSEFALPRLAREQSGTLDLVFVDGWHTFDHTLVDLFYANRLVRVGGYIVVDDCTWKSVSRAVAYLSNYPAYRLVSQAKEAEVRLRRRIARSVARLLTALIPRPIRGYVLPKRIYEELRRVQCSSMVALKKVAEDTRNFDWFVDF